MFELPEAKRVRRADLNAWGDSAGSESDDEGYDAELQAKLNAQIARSLGLDEEGYAQSRDITATPSHLPGHQSDLDGAKGGGSMDDEADADVEEEGDAGNEEFAFRLFSSARPSQKVVLEEDTGPQGDGGLAHPRPLSYYMVTNLTPNKKRQYAFAAMSGDEILARSKDRAWGLELPWKVTKIAVTRKRKPGESTCTAEDETKKKPRPGKKQRISLRKRAKTDEERKQAEAQKLMEKEEHSKDKKKRMNRLKKLRKRAKNKEMKLAAKDGEAGAEESGDDSEGSD